eukprot:4417607-Prymnesium_polylepis.1
MVCPISARFCGCFALFRGCFACVAHIVSRTFRDRFAITSRGIHTHSQTRVKPYGHILTITFTTVAASVFPHAQPHDRARRRPSLGTDARWHARFSLQY